MKTVIAAALGECVHVAGIMNFLRLAEEAGWRTVFLGPAVPAEDVIEGARREKAGLVSISYRLTPETGERLLTDFIGRASALRAEGVRFVMGGTPPVAERARALGFFERVFDGSEPVEEVLGYLKGRSPGGAKGEDYPQSAIERIRWKSPYPIIRHHFGRPTVEETGKGINRIADAGVLDVVSLGTDQDAQENFFHPERQEPGRRGAGGVPVRSADDYRSLYEATRRGNYPLMRTYSGTDDFLKLAELYTEAINIAWCAIPLFWFNRMDGRGPWELEDSIGEHQRVMAWYGERGIPVEVNEPHHWSLRDAPDVLYVATSYLSAYNARAFGVRDHIVQMMFNTPPALSDSMDIAKMLACMDVIGGLSGPDFRVWRQTRTGLLSYPLDVDEARAHLAASVYVQMALEPHIVHVVGHTEAVSAASAADVIADCRMARRAIENARRGQPDMTSGAAVVERKEELIREAVVTIDAIKRLAEPGVKDPLTDPATLGRAVRVGLLDAPHLRNNLYARGEIVTRMDDRGGCVAVDPGTGVPIAEEDRIAGLELYPEPGVE